MPSAQEDYLSGQVMDSLTREPLAFVSIVYNSSGQGVVTNLEGNFRIPVTSQIRFLNFRYVGYRQKAIPSTRQNNYSKVDSQSEFRYL